MGATFHCSLLAACMLPALHPLAGCNPRTPAVASEPTPLPPSSTTAVRTTRPSATLRAATSTHTPLPSPALSLTLSLTPSLTPYWSIRFAPPWQSIPWRICPGSSQTLTARLRPVTMSATRASISPITATGRAPPSSASASSPSCRGGWPRRSPIHTPSGIWSLSKPRTRSFPQSCSSGCRSAPANRYTASTPTCKHTPLVALNDRVIACQQVGAVGTSGNSVEPHLHFETRLGPPGATFASMRFYKANATQEEREITRCGAPAASSAHSTRWLCSFLKINGGHALSRLQFLQPWQPVG